MRLFCMQHGACLSKELDPNQPLSPVGRDMIRKSAAALRTLGLDFDAVLSSPKERAHQTAAIVARAVDYPEHSIRVTETVKAMATPEETVEFLRDYRDAGQIFLAGHLPHLNKLACHLLGSDREINLGIEQGGLICLETDLGPRPGKLVCVAPSALLHALADAKDREGSS